MADAFTSETYNALCRDAEGYLARGLAEQARELLIKATSLIGTRPRARSLLADACMQLGLWKEAEAQLEALATLEVDNIYTHFRLGQVLEETGENELARDNFLVVLDMNPDHHGAKVALARLEKTPSASSSSETARKPEGQQVFADYPEAKDIFAGESSEIDDLLNNIGLGENKNMAGVDALLDSIGINDEKKDEKHKVDFDNIFGNSGSDEPDGDSPVMTEKSGQQAKRSFADREKRTTDFSAIFSGNAEAEEPVPEEKFSQESEPAAEESPSKEPVSESPEADLSAIFGSGSSEEAAAAEPAEDVAEEIFPQEPEPVLEDPPEEFPVEEPSIERQPSDKHVDDSHIAELDLIFGEIPASEPAAEESPSKEPVSESPEADLSAIFGSGSSEEAAAAEPAEDVAEENFSQESEPAAEESLSEEPLPESPEADLSAIFISGSSEEAAAAEPPEEEPPEEEPSVEESSADEVPPESEENRELEEAQSEAAQEEEPVGITIEVPVVAEVDSDQSSSVEGSPVSEEPEPEYGTETVVYTVLPGGSDSLCTLKVESGSVRVLKGFIVSLSKDLKLDRCTVSGNGTALLGLGSSNPVPVSYRKGMTVRIDKLAVSPSGMTSESAGIDSVPSMWRLTGEFDGLLLFFTPGRYSKIKVSEGLRVRSDCILSADPTVNFSKEEDGFLQVEGYGSLTVAG
ncbi:hypothetical protein CSA37_11230 [Candidatus Fermentibacteria bacterium]|nr:MAG: hypothetical protein CSA37_11230 [Candidatus Fermentibacteria bacterium]